VSRPRSDVTVTPEAVAVTVDVAGLGSRMIALIFDSLIQAAVLIGVGFLLAWAAPSGTAGLVVLIVVYFLGLWGYFPVFEGLWSGQTPGKRAQRIRVVRTDGQPVTFAAVMVRNLVRVVDFLPGYYVVGALSIVLTRRSQRLGDLAAGTMVIRERPAPAPRPLDPASPATESLAARMDTAGLTERDYGLIRSFLERRTSLEPSARQELAARLAGAVRPRVGGHWTDGLDDEAFLAAVAQAYRERFRVAPARPDL
jgi:uncharacterized RDD family membrane protein YckC